MIMHGTWYKGPQLAHTHSTGAPSTTEYHQFRSYPSFVVTPYHENPSSYEKTFPTAASTPLLVDSVFNGAGGGNGGNSGHLTVLSPTIKIEQNYNEPLSGAVEDYALNLVDCSVGENGHFKKPSNYIWSAVNADSEANNNTIPGDTTTTQIPITNTTAPIAPGTPPTPPPDSQLSVEQALKSTYNNSLKQLEDTQLIQLPQLPQEDEDEEEHQQQQQQQQHQHQQHQHQSITKGPGLRTGVVSSTSHTNKANKSKTLLTENHNSHLNSHHPHHPHHPHPHPHSHHSTTSTPSSSTMPIGGVQGQNPTQGLVHWMSAVMAEHMTGQTHHDPTAVGMHYMWNGNVDHYGQHNKEIGDHNFWPPTPPTTASAALKTKMNDHHNNLQKGHFIDDNRLDHHAVTPQGGGVLGPTGAGHHGNHVGHHSSSAASALLVVPQPINATKIGTSLGGGGGGGGGGAGTGRKYQCKMCPQSKSWRFAQLNLINECIVKTN